MPLLPPPIDVMDNRHWPCDVLEMRGKTSARVLMFTDENPDGIERTVPIRRLIAGQAVIFEEETA